MNLTKLFCSESQSVTRILASPSHQCKEMKKISSLQWWQRSCITKLSAHSGSFSTSPYRGSDSFGFSCFLIGDSGRESCSCSFSCGEMGESGREDKRPSSSDWRSTWLGSASQISSSYAFVLNFSVISSRNMLYMVESMFRETRKIINQSPTPTDALVTRW